MSGRSDIVALFDLDGVILDTEGLYTSFWTGMGDEYSLGEDFGTEVKGQTLKSIFSTFLGDRPELWPEIKAALDEFEARMSYRTIPGAVEFLDALKGAGVETAIVTSSNKDKMANVYKRLPTLPGKVRQIFTSEYFTHSKPNPECFIRAREFLGGVPEKTAVFEDSVHGLSAAGASGAMVVGLVTTNPPEVVERMSDHSIPDFTGLTPQILREWIDER